MNTLDSFNFARGAPFPPPPTRPLGPVSGVLQEVLSLSGEECGVEGKQAASQPINPATSSPLVLVSSQFTAYKTPRPTTLSQISSRKFDPRFRKT